MKIVIVLTFVMFSFLFSRDSLNIAVLIPFTGDESKTFQDNFNSFEMATNENNLNLKNKYINLRKYDNMSSVVGTVQAAKKIVKDGVKYVLGCSYSSYSYAAGQVFQQNDVVLMTDTSTNPDVTLIGDHIFRICFTDDYQGKIISNFAITDLNLSNFSIVTDIDNRYSIGLTEIFKSEILAKGKKIINNYNIRKVDKDFTEIISDLKNDNPEAVFLPLYEEEAGLFMKQAIKLGLSTIFLGGDSWSGSELFKYADDYITNAYYCTHWSMIIKNDKSQAFIEKYNDLYSSSMELQNTTALSYDSANMLIRAINECPKDYPLYKFLAEMEFDGVTGHIKFDENRNPLDKHSIINRVDGKNITFIKEYIP
ncbi:MAG: ABC transporter substrate-binding protein [Candidatus Delongbacteria bacterium]|nr:ABC transporter substrate-binding protein [Candidatus Delongbacteria bacterium]MBN2834367.1 ABC transporter substrate-binding protein [Candidatus Delongbacteria bacterium]